MQADLPLDTPSQVKRRDYLSARPALPLLLLTFFALSALWAFLIPIPTRPPSQGHWTYFNPDGWNHVAVIEYMATHRQFPPFTFQYNTSIHPPLYHTLAAIIYGTARTVASHQDAVRLLRLFSCLIGTLTVWFVYRAARHLLSRPASLLAAGCVAGLPMFVSLSAAVNNENLSALAAAAALYFLIAGVRQGFDRKRVLALSLWIAVGIGSKITCLGLLPTAFVALLIANLRHRGTLRRAAAQMLVVVGVSVLCMGWWFVRNHVLYGDPLRQTVERPMWKDRQPGYEGMWERQRITKVYYVYLLTFDGWTSFWGRFGPDGLYLHERAYLFLAGLRAASVVGIASLWFRRRLRGKHYAAGGVLAVFWLFVVVGYYGYNWIYYAPEGRYFFPLLLPYGLLMAAGWRALFPHSLRGLLSGVLLAILFALNLHTVLVISANAPQVP